MRKRTYPILLAIWVLALVAAYVTGSLAIEINKGNSAHAPLIISAPEIVGVVYTSLGSILLFPLFTNWELRRLRARLASLGDALFLATTTAIIGFGFFLAVKKEYGEPPYPQWELIFNNLLLYTAIVILTVTLLGRTRGIVTALAVYVALNAVVAYRPQEFFWPLVTFTGPGPWWSTPHIICTATILLLSFAIRYRTAGAANSALNRDN